MIIKKDNLLLLILTSIFIYLSITISINLNNKFTNILIGINISILFIIIYISKKYYTKYQKNNFIKFTYNIIAENNIVGIIIKNEFNSFNFDYALFLPNKILLFYIINYHGIVTINENIYDKNNKILKNITKIKNSTIIDTENMHDLYNEFRSKSFDYNDIEVIGICYVHDADYIQSYSHNVSFGNNKNILQIINYNVLEHNNVYPYKDFIKFIKEKKVLS